MKPLVAGRHHGGYLVIEARVNVAVVGLGCLV
jgi:hypothetical protein